MPKPERIIPVGTIVMAISPPKEDKDCAHWSIHKDCIGKNLTVGEINSPCFGQICVELEEVNRMWPIQYLKLADEDERVGPLSDFGR